MWFAYAAAAAVCFGVRGILYQWTSRRPVDRNLLLFAVYLSGMLISGGLNGWIGQPWNTGAVVGIAMGLFSFISNAAMYRGFAVGRASLIALLTALPPVVVVLLAYALWGEKLNGGQIGAFAIVMVGLLVIRYSQDIRLGQLDGLRWGLMAMLFFGLTDISSKEATLQGASTLPVLTVMYGTGMVCFGVMWLFARRGKGRQDRKAEAAASAAGPPLWSAKRTIGWGLIVGISNIAGMMLIIPAFRDGVTGLVSAIIAMNVILVLGYARFVLKESMSRRELIGLCLALLGVLWLRLA